jgi:predicted metal-dependent hydrolase
MHRIDVNGLTVDVVRKNIKNLHLGVYPPNGRVRVAVPTRVNDEAVRLAVISKLGWIKRQQIKFEQQERESLREYVSGESHYVQGKRYLLNVIEQDGTPRVEIRNKKWLDLYVRPNSTRAQRERVISAWYRERLRESIPQLIAKWEQKIGVHAEEWGIKKMKTKWGTCNIKERRIWLNLELAKKSEHCLEYVIVHELVHLLERLHNERFLALMNKFMSNWTQYRDDLNRMPLSHAEWDY